MIASGTPQLLEKQDSDAVSENECAEVLAEQVWGHAGQYMAASNYSEKLIEQKERELLQAIHKNYSKIRGVEKELAQLQLQVKLTAGPKKHALELLRRKIESQNDKVVQCRTKYNAAKQVVEKLEEDLKREVASKDQLCEELNILVQQSAFLQLNRLEELKQKLESMTEAAKIAAAPTPLQDRSRATSTGTAAPVSLASDARSDSSIAAGQQPLTSSSSASQARTNTRVALVQGTDPRSLSSSGAPTPQPAHPTSSTTPEPSGSHASSSVHPAPRSRPSQSRLNPTTGHDAPRNAAGRIQRTDLGRRSVSKATPTSSADSSFVGFDS